MADVVHEPIDDEQAEIHVWPPAEFCGFGLQGECTVTESPNIFKLCEIKDSLYSNKMTKPYDPLFRNTRDNRDNTKEKIFKIYNVPYLYLDKRS